MFTAKEIKQLSSPFPRLPLLVLSQTHDNNWSGMKKHQFYFKNANIKLKRKFYRGHRVIQVSHYLTAESHFLIEKKTFCEFSKLTLKKLPI